MLTYNNVIIYCPTALKPDELVSAVQTAPEHRDATQAPFVKTVIIIYVYTYAYKLSLSKKLLLNKTYRYI